ncbi:MAG: branched-chain amino acid ABC transporter permease [Sulfolobales archaeon]
MVPLVIFAAIGVLVLVSSLSGSQYLVRFITNMLMWVTLTQSLNTITGYTGRVDFGHVIFFGVGAYAMALMISSTGSWMLGLIAAAISGIILAIVIGYPTLRLQGAYFAIATWSFAEAMKQLVFNTPQLGGSFGISIQTSLTSSQIQTLMAIVAALSILLNIFIERSRLGKALIAIRGDETAALAFGVNAPLYRLVAYILSSIPASLSGAVYAIWIGYVYPGDVFHGLKTDMMFVMLLLGGAGSYLGAFLGSVILSVAYEILWTFFSEQLYLVILGMLLVAIVLLMPNGIVGLLKIRTASARKLLISFIPRSAR